MNQVLDNNKKNSATKPNFLQRGSKDFNAEVSKDNYFDKKKGPNAYSFYSQTMSRSLSKYQQLQQVTDEELLQ